MPIIEDVPGATPIEDISDLIPTHIATRSQLNEWEAANILKAARKYLRAGKRLELNVETIKDIHREMFDEAWKWAGKIRQSNFNIGVDWHKILEEVKKLVNDIGFWGKKTDAINIFEQSVRIHHRLVKIHPFVNGNGRHARLVSDIFLFSHDHKLPVWPDQRLIDETDVRKEYIKALQAADKGNYSLLERFTKSLTPSE